MSFMVKGNKLSITDVELAQQIAVAAGKLLLALREDFSGDLDELRDLGDANAQKLIAQLLA